MAGLGPRPTETINGVLPKADLALRAPRGKCVPAARGQCGSASISNPWAQLPRLYMVPAAVHDHGLLTTVDDFFSFIAAGGWMFVRRGDLSHRQSVSALLCSADGVSPWHSGAVCMRGM